MLTRDQFLILLLISLLESKPYHLVDGSNLLLLIKILKIVSIGLIRDRIQSFILKHIIDTYTSTTCPRACS